MQFFCFLLISSALAMFNETYSFPTPTQSSAHGSVVTPNTNSGTQRNNNPFSSIISRLKENHVLEDKPGPDTKNSEPTSKSKPVNDLSKRNDVEDNEFERQQEREINEKINALGLKTRLYKIFDPTTSTTTTTRRTTHLSFIHRPTHDQKINTKRKDFDLESEENEDDTQEVELDDEGEGESEPEEKKIQSVPKKSKEKKQAHSTKLSKNQLNQIYKFIKKKSKSTEKAPKKSEPEEDTSLTDEDALISSMLLAPNSEVSEDLKDSVSAKKAQSLLLKWHKHAPYATLHDLKDIYNKFYEYYFEHYTKHEPTPRFFHHYHHHYPHGLTYDPYYSPHDHMLEHDYNDFFGAHFHPYHHHYHHHQHNLNLLDYISSKTNSKKTELIGKLLGQTEIYDPDYYHLDHYHHHDDDHHHLHHHHDDNPLSAELKELNDYNSILKQQLNYYSSQGLSAPVTLVNEYNHVNHLITTKTLYLTEHAHFEHPWTLNGHGHFYQHNFHYEDAPHYDGMEMVHHTTTLTSYPPIPTSPVVCNNYPEHNTDGFKSFISVESCTQPSYLSASGVPVFGNGCTFHYVCEIGYQPAMANTAFNGVAGVVNIPTIKCINGFWSARAICIKRVGDIRQISPQNSPLSVNQINLIKRTDPVYFTKSANQFKRFKRADSNADEYQQDVVEDAEENEDYDDGNNDDNESFGESDESKSVTNHVWENANKTIAEASSNAAVKMDLNLEENKSEAGYGQNIDWKIETNIAENVTNKTTTMGPEATIISTSTIVTTTTPPKSETVDKPTTVETPNTQTNRVTRQPITTASLETTEANELANNDSDKTIYESFYALLDNSDMNVRQI